MSEFISQSDLSAFAKVRRYAESPANWLRPGAKLRVQSLTERERAAVERRMLNEKEGEVSHRSMLIQLALVDGEGRRIYCEDDLPELDELDAMVTSRLIEAIDKHCQMGSGSSEAKRIEDAEKN